MKKERPEPTIGNIIEALKQADPEAKVFFRPHESDGNWALWEGDWFPNVEEVWTFTEDTIEKLKEMEPDLKWSGLGSGQDSMTLEQAQEYGLDDDGWLKENDIDPSTVKKQKTFVIQNPYD